LPPHFLDDLDTELEADMDDDMAHDHVADDVANADVSMRQHMPFVNRPNLSWA
jgi:hypothetical protein